MTDFIHYKILNYGCKDIDGKYPDKSIIRKSFFHPKTRRVYTVVGYIWNSSTDQWNVHYSRRGCEINFTKTMDEFKEKFIQIEGDTPEEDD